MLAALPSATPTDDNVDTVIATALARATRGTPLDFPRARKIDNLEVDNAEHPRPQRFAQMTAGYSLTAASYFGR